jgi:hypothetical protein
LKESQPGSYTTSTIVPTRRHTIVSSTQIASRSWVSPIDIDSTCHRHAMCYLLTWHHSSTIHRRLSRTRSPTFEHKAPFIMNQAPNVLYVHFRNINAVMPRLRRFILLLWSPKSLHTSRSHQSSKWLIFTNNNLPAGHRLRSARSRTQSYTAGRHECIIGPA